MTHTKQLLLVAFCYTNAEIGASFRTDAHGGGGRTEGQMDMEVEIVIYRTRAIKGRALYSKKNFCTL